MIRLLAFVPAILAQVVFAEEISQYPAAFYETNTEAYTYTDKAGHQMPYRLFRPHNYDPKKQYPLILSFHGAGERGNDNLKQLKPWVAGWMDEQVQNHHPCLILMPQCPDGEQWVDTPWQMGSYSFSNTPISNPMRLAKQIFDKVVQENSVDRSRIYVMGASMGGYATWNFAIRYPELVAAAVPVCGAGDPSMAKTIKNIPIWAFHGDADDVVPPSGSQDMLDAIKRAGGTQAQLTIFHAVKHDSYLRAWRQRDLVDWIFKQNKTQTKSNGGDGK